MQIFPVSVFAVNTFMNLVDSGVVECNNVQCFNNTDSAAAVSNAPFAYFKLVAVVIIIGIGVISHILYAQYLKYQRANAVTATVGNFSTI